MVDVERDLIRGGVSAGDGVHLALDGGDHALVLHGCESLAFLDVKVHVADEELGVHVQGRKGGSRGRVHRDLSLGENLVFSVRGVGLFVHDGAILSERAEGHLDLDLVGGQSRPCPMKFLLNQKGSGIYKTRS